MKKHTVKPKVMVQGERLAEKLFFVQFGQVRRHSRVLYIPLDPMTVRLERIKKGDIIKYSLIELRRAPAEDEEEQEKGEL
jgi:hypothetical protein